MTCLVIIDMQNGFMNEYTRHLPEKIRQFANANHFDCILATRYCNTPETPCYRDGWTDCMSHTIDAQLVPEVAGIAGKVFDKHIYSTWTPEFAEFLHHQQFEKLYFCGVNTDCCVLVSVLNCYDRNQECFVIGDLCASTLGDKIHENALEIIRGNITPERVLKKDSAFV